MASSSTSGDVAGLQPYAYPSHVNPASFVSIRLSDHTDYGPWKEQMMCLMESYDMLGFIHGTFKNPKDQQADKQIQEANYAGWKRSDALAKGWIFGSVSKMVMSDVVGLQTANDVWEKLKTTYGTPPEPTPAAGSISDNSDVAGSQLYPYPRNVNPASFVSIRFDHNNYGPWEDQMMCLLESHDMLGFIDGTFNNPKEVSNHHSKEKEDKLIQDANYAKWKRSDALAKGWILGSLSEDVMFDVVGLHTAIDVWKKLKTTYGTLPEATPPAPTTRSSKNHAITKLIQAILAGDWLKAEQLLEKDKTALTAKLNDEGDTALHLAVRSSRSIKFLEYLLKKIDPRSLPTMVNCVGQNALHLAAVVGNTKAAKMVVAKNQHLLFMADDNKCLPIHDAIAVPDKTTFLYLLEVSKQHSTLSQQDGFHSPFEGRKGAVLINNVMHAGLFDVAYQLIKEYPHMAVMEDGKDTPLFFTAKKSEAYYSGRRYNFYERFIYSLVLIEDSCLGHTKKIPDIENQMTDKANVVTKCIRSCFHLPVIQRMYIKLWKMTLMHVPHIKHLQKEKMNHDIALKLLKCICKESSRTSYSSTNYVNATVDAVINDALEAMEEIVQSSPQAILINRHRHLVQLAVINRSEKVYNFLVHLESDYKNAHQVTRDKDEINLLNFAAQLAPMHKLNVVSGAALQMQRELQWFQEVEKFSLPRHKEEKNSKQETPLMVFRRKHKELRKEGEEWMKKTADSYTITAALIITIVFAAAITVPGGNDGKSGKAIYRTKASFIIFAVSDAISLFTSTTSLLLFLSILTARYADEDFLYTLPKRLIFGLAMLFLSMTSMLVAFSATLYLMFEQGKAWIMIPIAMLTCLPIASFVTLQFPLLVELISSTYGQGIFAKQSDRHINKIHQRLRS